MPRGIRHDPGARAAACRNPPAAISSEGPPRATMKHAPDPVVSCSFSASSCSSASSTGASCRGAPDTGSSVCLTDTPMKSAAGSRTPDAISATTTARTTARDPRQEKHDKHEALDPPGRVPWRGANAAIARQGRRISDERKGTIGGSFLTRWSDERPRASRQSRSVPPSATIRSAFEDMQGGGRNSPRAFRGGRWRAPPRHGTLRHVAHLTISPSRRPTGGSPLAGSIP